MLSPHRDDAVFSLFFSLTRWAAAGVSVRVVNFFTRSAYAPWAQMDDISAISEVRRREDRRALTRISRTLRVRSFDFLDAPLRLPLTFGEICLPESARLLSSGFVTTLARTIGALVRRSLVLSPLTLGDHVDHVAVTRAALIACQAKRLAFYEDLPYAAWTSPSTLRQKVLQIEERSGIGLQERVIRVDRARGRKQTAAAMYSSQVNREEVIALARFSARSGGGERIWIPRASPAWNKLFECKAI